jgi:hypothetical protein
MNQYKALEHRRRLEKHLAKYPDQINLVKALITIYNTKYLPVNLRPILTAFVDDVIESSYKAEGIKPPKKPKECVVYKEKIVYRDRPISLPKKTLPSPIPPDRNDLQREAASVPPKAIPKPKPRIKKPKPTIDQPYHNRSALEELVTPLQQSVSKQFRGGGWGNDGVKNIRLGAGQSLPEGFKPGMLVKKRQELPLAK